MDICCVEDCGANTVRPMLMAPRCDVGPVAFYPCLPTCTNTVFCCEKPKPKHHHQEDSCHRGESHQGHRGPQSHQGHHGHQSREGQGHHSHHKFERRGNSPSHHDYCCRPPSPRPSSHSHCERDCKPVKTKYIIPCYRYEDGRIVRQLPVTAFKRNGMQDQEHGRLQGAANFLRRCPRDVELECDVCPKHVKVCDPVKVPLCDGKAVCCRVLKKKPIEVSLEDILDD